MKNKRFLLGILVIALVFGMMVVGCEEEDTPDPYKPPPPPEPGSSVSNPIDRIENTNLGTMTSSASGWQQLLSSINSTGKYINLDLSACTMTGTSFDPAATVETGKKYIVSIILPAVAESIEAGTLTVPTFKYFTDLKSISGANITTIGENAFSNSYSSNFSSYFESINFPKVTTIGNSAFYSCRSLKNVSFPLVQSIGEDAFSYCENLESISFPASAELGLSSGNYSNPFTYCKKLTFTLTGTGSLSVIENGKALVRNSTILLAYPSASGNVTLNSITALNDKVFQGCSDLTVINFPNVTTIGSKAFAYCGNIQDVSFPQTTSIGSSAFENCSRLQSASFPLVTTIDTFAFSTCRNLLNLNIPKVTNIEYAAFSGSDNTALMTITMGSAAPTLERSIFSNITTTKTVKVKIPSGATGYSPFTGTSITVSGTNTAVNWANGFRGRGWDGYAFLDGYIINDNISLTIEYQ